MMKYVAIILGLLSGLILHGQSDIQKVVQIAIDFPVLKSHLDSQQIIITKNVKFIRDNGILDTNLVLTYNGNQLEFNDGKGAKGFTNGWTFDFSSVKVKSRKANISYKYIPQWKYCLGDMTLAQANSLFFVVELKFQKNEKGEWGISDYEVSDIVFGESPQGDYESCLASKYKPINDSFR